MPKKTAMSGVSKSPSLIRVPPPPRCGKRPIRVKIQPRSSHGFPQPLDSLRHRDSRRRRNLANRLDHCERSIGSTPLPEEKIRRLTTTAQWTRHHVDSVAAFGHSCQHSSSRASLLAPHVVETGVGIGVPTRRGSPMTDQVHPDHMNQPGSAPPGRPASMNHSVPNAMANISGDI